MEGHSAAQAPLLLPHTECPAEKNPGLPEEEVRRNAQGTLLYSNLLQFGQRVLYSGLVSLEVVSSLG